MAKFSLRRVHKDLNPLKDLYSQGELAALSKHGTIIDIAPGENLMEEGTEGSEVAIIVEGQARISENGNFISNAEAGDILGDQAVLNNATRRASVFAVTVLKISVLNVEAFANTLKESTDFRHRLDAQIQSRAA